MASLAQWFRVSMKSLELSTILTVAPPLTVSWMPSSVGREFLTISSVPSAWTRTATVPGFTLETGISTLVSPEFLGSSILTVGAVLESREASTSTGALTASPDFFASSMALLLKAVFASVWPFLSVFTVAVEPSAALVSVTELPSFLVSVLVTEPSFLVSVWILVPSALVVVPVLVEGLLELLELPYRVITLCTGDMGLSLIHI